MTFDDTATEKLAIFARAIITLYYAKHESFDVFLNEWEFTIERRSRQVKELNLFDSSGGEAIITHRFDEVTQRSFFDYFEKIGIVAA